MYLFKFVIETSKKIKTSYFRREDKYIIAPTKNWSQYF